jgi:Fe-S cluster assembly scaffold protein SufB
MIKTQEELHEIIKTKYSKVKAPKNIKIKNNLEWEIVKKLNEDQNRLVEKIISALKIKLQENPIFIFPSEKKIIAEGKKIIGEKIKIYNQNQNINKHTQPIENIIKEYSKCLNIKLEDNDTLLLISAEGKSDENKSSQNEEYVFIPNSLKIEIEKGSHVRIFKILLDEAKIWNISSTEILVRENSKLELFSFEQIGEKARFFERTKTSIDKKSEVKEANIWGGEGKGYLIKDIILDGEESSGYDYHIISSTNSKNLEVIHNMEHKGEKTKGEVMVRILAKDKSQVIFLQNAKIDSQAKWSDSFIEGKAINFSDDARVFLTPSMYIDTNIVSAKHSASVAKVGENEIFYLTSRGIEPDLAEKIIIEGFFYEVATKMQNIADIENLIPKLLYHHPVL